MKMIDVVKKGISVGRERLQRARDTNYTTDTYHGSTHDLTEMDASKTNIEGDWGKGIYSSNNIDDVNENYAGVGPDLTARIEQQRERLQDDILDEIQTNGLETTLQRYSELLNDDASTKSINDIEKYRDNDEGFAKDLADIVARKQIKGSNDGVVYPLKQNTEGFATIGGKDRTIVEGRDYHAEAREEIQRSDYDDEYDYQDAVEEYAFDLMNSDYDTNYQKVLEVIDRRGGGVSVDDLADAFDGDSVDLTKLDEIIRESQIYAEDDAGNFIPNGAVSAEILQNLGFKGVIDNTANTKFGSARDRGRPMDGMDEDTVHYITFEGAENQIRSRNAQFKDPTSRNLLAGSAATAITLPAMFGSSETEAGFFSQAVKAAQNLTRKTGNAQGFKNDLTGKGQVKPDELKAMGFDEHFGDRTDITKEEVQQFINDNQINIDEVRLGAQEGNVDRYTFEQNAEGTYDVYDPDGDIVGASFDTDELAARAVDAVNHQQDLVGVDTSKFGKWTLDGGESGENYRELLMTLPTNSKYTQLNSELGNLYNAKKQALYERGRVEDNDSLYTQEEYEKVLIALDQKIDELDDRMRDTETSMLREVKPFVNDGHFDEPNILAHLRMKDRVDADGNKTLLLEEVQSDWHQSGKESGYQNDARIQEIADSFESIDKRIEEIDSLLKPVRTMESDLSSKEIDDLISEYNDLGEKKLALQEEDFALSKGVPNAPFKTDDKSSWYNLAMKRGLIEAAEGDYDKLAITTGRQQADRYDLRKVVDSIQYREFDRNDGTRVRDLVGVKDGRKVFSQRIADPEKDLPRYIGKNGTKKLLAQENKFKNLDVNSEGDPNRSIKKVLEGDNLEIGGEGMKEFYDRKLPNTLNKLVKQDGVRVGQTTLAHPLNGTGVNLEGFNMYEASEIERLQDLVDRGRASEIDREYLANYLAREKPYGDTVHSIDITPEMRDRVKKGLPLFAQGGLAVGGSALFAPKDLQAAEYNEAPVIEEQSFGDMVNEYGQINRNLKALDDQRFARTIAEREARRGMSRRERRDNPPSEALRNLTMQEMKPSLGSIAQGVVEGNAQGLDYFHPLNIGRMILNPANEGLGRFIAPSIVNTYENAVSPVAKPVLFDERDPQAEEKSRSGKNFGNFFSLF